MFINCLSKFAQKVSKYAINWLLFNPKYIRDKLVIDFKKDVKNLQLSDRHTNRYAPGLGV